MSQVIKQKRTDLTTAFSEHFTQFSLHNDAIANLRRNAIEKFSAVGLPGNKHEEYKYTPITRALEKEFGEQQTLPSTYAVSEKTKSRIQQHILDTEANHLVFINGQFAEDLSTIISPADQLRICTLTQAFQDYPEVIEKYLGSEADLDSDPFIALNTAYAQDGVFLHVPKGKAVEAPVITYFFTDTTADNAVVQSRNLCIVEENGQIKLSETFLTLGDGASYNNAVTEILVNKYAHVHYYKYENESQKAYHTGTTQVRQHDNSHFHAVTVALQGAMIRNNLNIELDAQHCESHMYGLYMLDGKTHVDNHTVVDHQQPNAFSNELYKGIVDGSARGVFNGKIYVRPDAQKTNAFQSNANILLSNDASVDTKPQLEIWADDVKCSHGATTGQLDQEQMFYLRTRGLSKIQARAVLLKAFAGDVIQHIGIEALQSLVEQQISQRLEK
jgi:Fe-S cluster assembly protein SufD